MFEESNNLLTDVRPPPTGIENVESLTKSCKYVVVSPNSKQGSRNNSRSHSPVVHTPRRSSRSGSYSDLEAREGGEEAPLGYEPCGSAGDESPCSERSTPNVLKWAKDLQFVLDDYEGYQLFEQFLTVEGSSNELVFYYACKGLQRLDPIKERTQCQTLIAGIYKRFIRSQGECYLNCIKNETRKDTVQRIHDKDYRPNVFDKVVLEIVDFLKMKHEAFIRSDLYIQTVQQSQLDADSPRIYCNPEESQSSDSSTSGEPVRPNTGSLSTVQEEENNDSSFSSSNNILQTELAKKLSQLSIDVLKCDYSSAPRPSPGPVDDQPPPLPPRTNVCKKPQQTDGKSLKVGQSSSASNTLGKKKSSAIDQSLTAAKLEATISARSIAQLSGTLPRASGTPVLPHPYHTNYVPKLPPSMRDSAVSSAISSDADTVNGATAGDQKARQVAVANRKEHHRERVLRDTQMQHNLETNLKEKIIPRTQREVQQKYNPSGDIRERDAFALAIVEKLRLVRREQEKDEKLNESLRQLSEADKQANPIASRSAVEAFSWHCRDFVNNEEEDDKLILEDHMGKIGWNDSAKQSPGSQRSPGMPAPFLPHAPVPFVVGGKRRSPGSKSPDRRAASRAAMTSSLPSAAAFANQFTSSVVPPSAQRYRGPGQSTQFVSVQQKQSSKTDSGADRRPSLPTNTKTKHGTRPGMRTSDTSGIESGTSSGASCFSGILPNANTEQRWLPMAEPSDKVRKAAQATANSHRTANHRSSAIRPSSKPVSVDSSSLPRRGRRSVGGETGWPNVPMTGNVSQRVNDDNVVLVYYLPNEDVPYVTKVPGRTVTLKQFKQVLPRRQGIFKHFFKCPSNEFGTGVIQKEVSDDSELLPLFEGKIMAKVVAID